MPNTPPASPAKLPALFDLTGHSVCVIGGGGYLCRAACVNLAECGAHVVVADLSAEAGEAVAKQITDAGFSAEATPLDVGDEPALAAAFDRIAQDHGTLDAVVNATFFYRNVPLEEMTLDDWRDGMRINLDAAFLVSREAGRVMKPQGRGSIVHFTSMYGNVAPDPSLYSEGMNINPAHYGVAKAGVRQLVRYQAAVMGKHGIRVNAIAPGPFPFAKMQQDDPAFATRLGERTMLGRIGRADEIAGAVVYLVADASSFVTGSQLKVDAGWTEW